MTEPKLLVATDGAVRLLTLNRPEMKNALDRELVLALGEALDSAATDPSVRAVVLTGAGDAFCSGADLKSAMGGGVGDLGERMDEYHRMIRAIARAPKPFIAAVGGVAVGFGADLALACDLRIFGEHAYLQERFVKLGLMPDGGGSHWLPRLVGLGRAMEFLMLGTRLDAARCEALGIANRVVASGELQGAALALAHELAKGAPLALARIKQAVRASAADVDAALDREKAGQLELLVSKDLMEGVLAWAQRRDPVFRGE